MMRVLLTNNFLEGLKYTQWFHSMLNGSQRKQTLLAPVDNELLGWQIFKVKNEPPVEISLNKIN
jgi:hypothetical protein